MISRDQYMGGARWVGSFTTTTNALSPSVARVIQARPTIASGSASVVLPDPTDVADRGPGPWFVIVNRTNRSAVTLTIRDQSNNNLGTVARFFAAFVYLLDGSSSPGTWVVDVREAVNL